MKAPRAWTRTFLIAASAIFLALNSIAVSAHEHRDVANGTYTIEIGFLNEPAFVNQQNGLRLEVTSATQEGVANTPAVQGTPASDDNQNIYPVTGISQTLEAEVIFGDQKMPLPLEPTGDPGVYQSIFFPTAVGDYTFHVWGDIKGTPIDESFTSSPNGFDPVQGIEEYQFPKP